MIMLRDNMNEEFIEFIKRNKIDIDAILSIDDITAYLQGNNLFPVYQYVGSPDLASRRLYNGELLIIIDRVSNVLALPTTMALTSRMTIDNINIPLFSFFERSFIMIFFRIKINIFTSINTVVI